MRVNGKILNISNLNGEIEIWFGVGFSVKFSVEWKFVVIRKDEIGIDVLELLCKLVDEYIYYVRNLCF